MTINSRTSNVNQTIPHPPPRFFMTPLKHAIAVRIATRFKLIDRMKRKSFAPAEVPELVRQCLSEAAADENFTHYGITNPYTAVDSSTVFYLDVGTDQFKYTVYCRVTDTGSVALRTFSQQDLPDTWRPAADA